MFFGSALLILGGYIGWLLYADYKRIDADESARLSAQANGVDQNLARQLLAVDHSLASIRDDLPILMAQRNSKTLISRRLQVISGAIPGLRSISILDANGTSIASNRGYFTGQNFRERAYFQIARQGGAPAKLYV